MATRWGYDAVLVERLPGADDVNVLRRELAQMKGEADELVSVIPDPRGWIFVTRLPVG